MPVETKSLAEVVGQNCQRIRTMIGITQDELARYARAGGLRWTASKVGDFEAGRRAPTFATVLLVGDALAWAASVARLEQALSFTSDHAAAPAAVTLADLLDWDGSVALAEGRAISARDLASVARGEQFQFWGDMIEPTAARRSGGLTEQRLAKSLGINHSRLSETSFRLWQSTFSEERDRRAGPDANQQKKGRISREMRAELEKALADGDDK